MAKITAAAFKTQINAVAAALNLAYDDTITAGPAQEFTDPRNPLRQIEKLVTVTKDGVFATNTVYIDAMYAGNNVASPRNTNKPWNAI